MSTIDEIEKLAAQVVKDALAGDVTLEARVDALKVLKDIYVVQMKQRDKHPEGEDDDDFNGFRRDIEKAEEVNGTTPAVRSRRRGQHA